MAEIDYSHGVMNFSTFAPINIVGNFAFYGFPGILPVTKVDAHHFKISYLGIDYTYSGTGLHFNNDVNHTLKSGAITGVTAKIGAVTQATFTGLDIDAATAKQIWGMNDTTGYAKLVAHQLAHNDVIKGSQGNDYVEGFKGHDKIAGNAGTDTIYGGSGNDTVNGGIGNDYLEGNSGKDHFVFSSEMISGNADTIHDFSHADDTIDLSHNIFTALGSAGHTLSKSAFHALTDFSAEDSSDRIIYHKGTGDLYYDPDGKGGFTAVKFAHLDALPTISYNDFHIV